MDRTEFIDKLRKARALIQRGWTQGNYCTNDCYCLMGALMYAGIQEDEFRFVGWHRIVDSPAGKLIHWNDRPGRTQGEVLACIDNSIKALERGIAP